MSDKNFCKSEIFSYAVCLQLVLFLMPLFFFRFLSLSHKAIDSFFTGSQIRVAGVFSKFLNKFMCNIMLHLKLRVEKISLAFFFGMFWNRPLSVIITSASQAKFLGYFQSEN